MNNITDNELLNFEIKNEYKIKNISDTIFNIILDEFKDYKDVKESYRIKQVYIYTLFSSIEEALSTRFAFDVEEYYKNKLEVSNGN